uniref:Putative secreted protein n=1 Tax=Anopheles darlingi TaxID=43151 RepID=A0A2M4DJX6_ANODA
MPRCHLARFTGVPRCLSIGTPAACCWARFVSAAGLGRLVAIVGPAGRSRSGAIRSGWIEGDLKGSFCAEGPVAPAVCAAALAAVCG